MKDLHFDATIATSLVISHQTVSHHLEIGIHNSTNARKEEINGKITNKIVPTMVEPIEMQHYQIIQTYLGKILTILNPIINKTSITTIMVTYMTVGIKTFT